MQLGSTSPGFPFAIPILRPIMADQIPRYSASRVDESPEELKELQFVRVGVLVTKMRVRDVLCNRQTFYARH